MPVAVRRPVKDGPKGASKADEFEAVEKGVESILSLMDRQREALERRAVYVHPGGDFVILDTGDVFYLSLPRGLLDASRWFKAELLLMPLQVYRERRDEIISSRYVPSYRRTVQGGRVVSEKYYDVDEVLVDTRLGRYLVVGGYTAWDGSNATRLEYRLAIKDIPVEEYDRLNSLRRRLRELEERIRRLDTRTDELLRKRDALLEKYKRPTATLERGRGGEVIGRTIWDEVVLFSEPPPPSLIGRKVYLLDYVERTSRRGKTYYKCFSWSTANPVPPEVMEEVKRIEEEYDRIHEERKTLKEEARRLEEEYYRLIKRLKSGQK